LRLAADFDNARKRWEKDREEVVKYGIYKILKDLIVFVDEMEHAIEAMKKQDSATHSATFVEGVTMTCNKLKDLLVSEGVKELNPVGEKFDPYKHEILAQEAAEGVFEPVVSEVFQKGYLYNERLLRTAKVKVSIPKSATDTESQQEREKTTDHQSGINTINEQI
jgi:molecular chaperone GrpE